MSPRTDPGDTPHKLHPNHRAKCLRGRGKQRVGSRDTKTRALAPEDHNSTAQIRTQKSENTARKAVARLLIPAPLREKLNVRPGATLSITAGRSGQIRPESTVAAVRQAREYFCALAPPPPDPAPEMRIGRRRWRDSGLDRERLFPPGDVGR